MTDTLFAKGEEGREGEGRGGGEGEGGGEEVDRGGEGGV